MFSPRQTNAGVVYTDGKMLPPAPGLLPIELTRTLTIGTQDKICRILGVLGRVDQEHLPCWVERIPSCQGTHTGNRRAQSPLTERGLGSAMGENTVAA